jgi:8-oxo-dGTP pyrophosphatase MutT (NUDIX family)
VGRKYEPVEVGEREINGQSVTFLRHSSGNPGVAILVSDGTRYLLIRCRRPLIGNQSRWEIPRGFSDDHEPLTAALTELFEETGLTPTTIEPLGEIHADSGVLASSTQMFLASVPPGSPVTVGVEGIEDAKWVDPDQMRQMVALNEITDSFALSAFAKVTSRSQAKGPDSGGDLEDFFMREAAENLRHTDSKTIQIAGGVAAATAGLIAVGFRNLSEDPLSWSGTRFLALLAIATWSTAATTKMLRYRSWREHYLNSLQRMVGARYRDDAPRIFRAHSQVEPSGVERLRKRFFGDESFVGLSGIVAMSSSILLTLMGLSRATSGPQKDSGIDILVVAVSLASPLLTAFFIARALRFRIQ